jgi:stress-induced morphogen
MNTIISQLSVLKLKEAYLKIASEIQGKKEIEIRLHRAMDILCKLDYTIVPLKDESNSNILLIKSPNDTYKVTMKACTCIDGATTICKHRLVYRLLRDAFRAQRGAKKQ